MMQKYFLLGFMPLSITVHILLGFSFVLGFSFATCAQSKSESSNNDLQKQIVFQESFEPPGDGEPKDTSGAGSRSEFRCSKNEQPIKPLMPKRNYGLTLEAHPSIYIDLSNTSAQQVVLSFQDEAGQSYQRAFLPIPSRTGIVGFSLPDTNPPLAIGKNYKWSLTVVCGKSVQPDDPLFVGWVQRVTRSPDIERELEQKSATEQAAWYAARGYWYDMLTAMIQAKQAHPRDTKQSALWVNVLESVELCNSRGAPINLYR